MADGEHTAPDGEGTAAAKAVAWLAAGALQVSTSLALGGQEIRVALADAVVPVLALAVLLALLRREGATGALRRLRPSLLLIAWALAASAWWTVALFNGHDAGAPWNVWALQNKYVGWYALLFFLFAGAGFARTTPGLMRTFFDAWITVAWAVALATVAAFVVSQWVSLQKGVLYGADQRAVGLLANANAYGFAVATALVLQIAGAGPRDVRLRVGGLALLVTVLVLSGSRSAWIAAAAGLVPLIATGVVRWRPVLVGALAGTLVLFAMSGIKPVPERVGQPVTALYIAHEPLFDVGQHSAASRIDQAERGLAMWLESPLTGAGLGRFIAAERASGKHVPEQIHNSYLWLLAEAGPPALLLVGGLFVVVTWTLLGAALRRDPHAIAGLGVMTAFGVFALFQEALYQRHVWFLAGMFLVATAQPRAVRDVARPGSGSSRGQ